jgi:gliding motility-associated-like protein
MATNSSGCVDTITKTITVHSIPIPLFIATTSCAGAAVVFTDLSTDVVPISNWFYDFADGNNSLSQDPNYIYGTAGTYNVSLTVTNADGCSASVIVPVLVNVFPNASYSVDTVCIGSPTTFTDNSTGSPASWQWDFGDGSSGTTGPVITHVYTTAGSFVTELTVSSGAGCTDQAFQIVFVKSDVLADISAANSACVGSVVTINDNSTVTVGSILSDTWNFGDGSPIVNTLNTTHTYPSAGTYFISHVIVSNGGCISSALDTIVINPLPDPIFTTSNICELQVAQFTDLTAGPPVAWNWTFGDGGTSALQDPTHLYGSPGTYNVTLNVTSAAGCTKSRPGSVTVYSKPDASFTSTTVCWGDTTKFTNTSTSASGTITGNSWDFGDGSTSALTDPSHTYLAHTSSYNVMLAVITNYGCTDTLFQTVNTNPLPVFNFKPAEASGCDDFTATFSDSTTVPASGIVNWLWDFGDGNLSYLQYPEHTYDEPGDYYVSLVVTDGLGCKMADTLNYPVVVYPTPVAAFSADPNETSIYEPNIQFNDESVGATLWTWDLGDFETSIEPSPYHVYPDTGTYFVTQIVMNQFTCSDTIMQPVRITGETTTYIPNAFTPNDNGLNDVFAPKFYGIIEFQMLIFDRWGNQIFKTEDMKEGWNGKVNGQGEIVQQDVYVYKIFTKDLYSNNHRYVGRVTVVK